MKKILIVWLMLLTAITTLAYSVTLAWDPNTEPDIAGYRMYYGTESGVYTQIINVGNVTNYTVTNLNVGPIYYFAVTCYNTSGLESEFSNEVSFGYPVPVPIPTNLRIITGM